jgi:hypothetical protein
LLRNPVFAWVGPYVPGFAQLRAVARFAVVAQLGLSVLAAYGVAAWLEWRRASLREERLTAGILATLIFVEGLGLPLALQPFSPYAVPGDRFTYFWLSRHPGGALVELPLEGWSEARCGIYYQYRTLLHGHAVVNGVGRFRPPLLDMLGDPDSPVTAPSRAGEAATLLRAIGVRYVVLHRKWFKDKALGDAMRAGFVAAVGPPAAEFGDSTIVDLADDDPRPEPSQPATPVREVPREMLTLSAVRGNTMAMVDGNPATRWMSERPQDGTEWIEIRLSSTVQVTGVRLQLMGRSLNDYPRGLDVSISPGNGEFRSVFASGVLPQVGEGLRASPASPVIEVRWPAVAARVIRLRQTGRSARWYWSVHELAVLSAP